MRLTRQRLNRTLLRRQHLLERVDATPRGDGPAPGRPAGAGEPAAVPLPARTAHGRSTRTTSPARSRSRTLVRLLTMRGTIHLLTRRGRSGAAAMDPAGDGAEVRSSQTTRRAGRRPEPGTTRRRRRARGRAGRPQKALGGRLARALPGHAQRRAAPCSPVAGAAGPAAAPGHLEGQRRRGLRVRRPLGRRAAREPDVESTIVRRYLARVRPGLGRRRHRLVGRHPARSGAGCDGPRAARGRGRQGPLRRARRRDRGRGRPRAGRGCSAPTTTSGSPTPARDRVTDPTKRTGGWAPTAGSR